MLKYLCKVKKTKKKTTINDNLPLHEAAEKASGKSSSEESSELITNGTLSVVSDTGWLLARKKQQLKSQFHNMY